MIEEVWKDIPGHEGLYQVSSHGQVRRLGREIIRRGTTYKFGQRVLTQTTTPYGYKSVGLSEMDGTTHTMLVHRLVAMAFIPNPDNLPVINHKDENKINNSVENLEWCTRAYNNTYKDGAKRRGKKMMRSVCVELNGERVIEFDSIKDAAKYFHTASSTIYTRLKYKYRSKKEGYTFTYNNI